MLEQYIAKKKELDEFVKKNSQSIVEEFCKKAIDLTGRSACMWKAWIPAFNDGEPCEFSMKFHLNKLDGNLLTEEEEDDDEEGWDDFWDIRYGGDESLKVICKDLDAELSLLYDVFEAAFSYGVKIEYRDGQFFEDYYDCGY